MPRKKHKLGGGNIKAENAYDAFSKSGLVKQYEPFIRTEVAEFCKKYPRLNREHILIEAVRLALDAEKKFKPELGYDFSTLLRHYLKGLHRFAEKEEAFNIPITAILSDADRAAEKLRKEQEEAEAKTPEGHFPPGANGARVTFDFQSMEADSAEKRSRTGSRCSPSHWASALRSWQTRSGRLALLLMQLLRQLRYVGHDPGCAPGRASPKIVCGRHSRSELIATKPAPVPLP
jgi:hypothetical protein